MLDEWKCVLCPLEPCRLVCPFLNDKCYGPPFITFFHFIWALFFLFPNKNGIDMGARREWIIHVYSHIWYTISKRYHGLGSFIGTLRSELEVLFKHQSPEKAVWEDTIQALFEDLSLFTTKSTTGSLPKLSLLLMQPRVFLKATFLFAQFWKYHQ